MSQYILGLAHIGDPEAPVHYSTFATPEFLDVAFPEYNILERNDPSSLHPHGEMAATADLLRGLTEAMRGFYTLLSSLANSHNMPNSEVVSMVTIANAIMETIDNINEVMPRWFYDAVIVENAEEDAFDDVYFDNLQDMFNAYVGFADIAERFRHLAQAVELHFYNRGQELEGLNVINQAQLEHAHVQTNIGDDVDRNANIRNPATLTLCVVVFLIVGAGMLAGVETDTSSLSSSMSL